MLLSVDDFLQFKAMMHRRNLQLTQQALRSLQLGDGTSTSSAAAAPPAAASAAAADLQLALVSRARSSRVRTGVCTAVSDQEVSSSDQEVSSQ